MSEAMHRAALAGDQMAREMEEHRLLAETEVTDRREADRADGRTGGCYRVEVHEEHDYEDVVWSEPRWVNPRSVWLRWCGGVRDESPYETITESQDRGVWVWKQDEAAPPGEFKICRRLIVSRSYDKGEVNFDTEIWKKPPREWPPVHIGDNGAGVNLDVEQVRAVRDWMTLWLQEHGEP